ncbi:MAG TPA: hypothetical protein VFN61_00705 [Acidimicrobiales bacterium]|nr:hypothetical protein [Acidimicrobiales bacterium]
MRDKLEVLAGPGLVARFGDVALWAGPQASAALQAHLVSEAQRLSGDPGAGDQLANSFISVLQRGDPEPNSAFAVLGPGANGITLFLHGPVQAWDSGHWLAPQPVPGWLVTSIGRPWPLIVLPYGANPPPQSQPGNPLDLVTGAVPGAGFVLLRPTPSTPPPGAPGGAVGQHQAPQAQAGFGAPTVGQGAFSTPTPGGTFGAGSSGTGFAEPAPRAEQVPAPFSQGAASRQAPPGGTGPSPRPQFQFGSAPAAPAGPLADLRSIASAAGPATPLPLAGASEEPGSPDLADVPGNRCDQGHFNHPRASTCARCGHALSAQAITTAKRPPLGILLADDGSVWSLERGCLIGSAPTSDPEVMAGKLQPLVMRAGANHTMAPVHAEVQLRDWSVYLVDRGADGGTCVQAPTSSQWSVLGRNEQRELVSGSHISCGGRVLTFVSAWPV